MHINASSLPVLFTSKIRDRAEGIVMYSVYTWFSFLTWVWVNIFLEIVSSKMATTHNFQSGVRNWPASVSWHEIEVFNPQTWDSRLRRESGRYRSSSQSQVHLQKTWESFVFKKSCDWIIFFKVPQFKKLHCKKVTYHVQHTELSSQSCQVKSNLQDSIN